MQAWPYENLGTSLRTFENLNVLPDHGTLNDCKFYQTLSRFFVFYQLLPGIQKYDR